MKRGKFIILFGPTGSGKSHLIEHARKVLRDVYFVLSYTTRERRNATENEDYRFVSVEEFQKNIEDDMFLEWAEYGKNYYGTSKKEVEEQLEKGELVLKEMEVQGIRKTLEALPRGDIRLVYVEAGPWEELENRIRARAPMSDEDIARRKLRYEDEITLKEHADAIVHNPQGKLEEAKQHFIEVVEAIREEIR